MFYITFLAVANLLGTAHGGLASTWDDCGCRWDSWQSWSSCTETCGGGYQRRERKVWVYDTPECGDFEACATSDMAYDYGGCNRFCMNGGTFVDTDYNDHCTCMTGNKGSCCEQSKLMLCLFFECS